MSRKQRERMTWAVGHQASAPPATPGYNVEDQDHPAKQGPDPDMHKYEDGDTSSWAEDVRQPPYPQGNPPAIPGYDAEDQDHPAHESPPRVSLTAAVRKRASKCLKLATIQLVGKKMTKAQVEDHAMDLMELGDSQIDNMLERFGGGFLADELEVDDDLLAMDDMDDLLAMDDMDDMALEEPILASNDNIMAKLEALTAEVVAMKSGSDDDEDDDEDGDEDGDVEGTQNDPKGPTLCPKVKASDDPIVQEFDSYDTGKTGFVGIDEWKGSKTVFAALDTDNDQILARVDLMTACGEVPATIEAGLEPEEMAMLAEMSIDPIDPIDEILEDEVLEDEVLEDDPMELELMDEPIIEEPMIVAEDDAGMFGMTHDPMGLSDNAPVMSSEDDALLQEIFGGKVAKKSDDDEEVIEEEVEGKKKAKKSDEDEEVIEEEEVEGKKKAKKSDEDEEVIEEEVEGKKKKAAVQRPQPRKKSAGVQQVGNMTKAAANSEMLELQNMWASSPDVSKVFGS